MSKKSEKHVAKAGRPSSFTEEVADTICQELMAGKSLRTICAMENMPWTSTVFRWLEQYPEFRNTYARAREIQADMLADEIVEIADSETDPNRARVMIDARKWLASKLRPKRYGDRVELEHTNNSGMGAVIIQVCAAPVREVPAIDVEPVKPALEE